MPFRAQMTLLRGLLFFPTLEHMILMNETHSLTTRKCYYLFLLLLIIGDALTFICLSILAFWLFNSV